MTQTMTKIRLPPQFVSCDFLDLGILFKIRSILRMILPVLEEGLRNHQSLVRGKHSLKLWSQTFNDDCFNFIPFPSRHQNTMADTQNASTEALIKSEDPKHPANLICSLCRQFYTFGWVTGTGGGISIRHEDHVFLAPSGVEKELMQPENIFVMDWASKEYIRRPLVG